MPNVNSTKRLKLWLTVCFTIAMLMGPGPGLYLVNPDATAGEASATMGNVPVLYLWALFWYGVQVTVLVFAYFLVWERPNDPA